MRALLNSVLSKAVSENLVTVNVNFNEEISEIVNSICYRTLENIHDILDDESLSDFDCVEKIVCELEKINFDGGSRHDFG